jgi:hypothetical protein
MSIHGFSWSRSTRRARGIAAIALIAGVSFAADGGAQERVASGVTRPQQRVSDPAAFAIEMGGGLAGMMVGGAAGYALLAACLTTAEDTPNHASPLTDASCAAPTVLAGAVLVTIGGVIGVKWAAGKTGAPRSTGGAIIGVLAGAAAGGLVVNAIGNTFDESSDALAVSTYVILQGMGLALGSRGGGR